MAELSSYDKSYKARIYRVFYYPYGKIEIYFQFSLEEVKTEVCAIHHNRHY